MIDSEKTTGNCVLAGERISDSFFLYGSYARGDYDAASDVDVLHIATSRACGERIDGRVSLHTYDIRDLLAMARRGSLFILHLLREAKPLHDPRGLLADLSTAFRKPDSYAFEARRTLGPASALLDIDESLFETAPQAFIGAAIFLSRTLVYAEHADHGPFSFSLRSLAEKDETAAMLRGIKDRSSSHSDFRRVRQVVRSKLASSSVREDASSIQELAQRSQGDPLFEGLLWRISKGLRGDPYQIPASMTLSATTKAIALRALSSGLR
jgi:hypothetical protein